MNTRHADPRVQRVIDYFETLSRQSLKQLDGLYVDDARFKDPFNEVGTREAIAGIFEHMFDTLDDPRFVIEDAVAQGDQCFLTWDFGFGLQRLGPQRQRIRGATQIRFAPDGRIALHRDWWDAAEELYEKLPIIGALMRWLRARAAG